MQAIVKYEQEMGGIVLDPSQAPAPLPTTQDTENSQNSHHHHHHHKHGKAHGLFKTKTREEVRVKNVF